MLKSISNLPGWSTRRRIVVFLVDDFGSVRIPDNTGKESLIRAGIDCNASRFNRLDTLASAEDLSLLFETLSGYTDRNGRHPVFTAMTTVANPDFGPIRESGFRDYYYEPFTSTLDRYYGKDAWSLWEQGIGAGLFVPQFHGREHLHVRRWMEFLRRGDQNLLTAFEHRAIGVPLSARSIPANYMAAFDLDDAGETDDLVRIGIDGLRLFRQIFGYDATLFTSSGLIHSATLEEGLAGHGIRFVDRAKISHEPSGGGRVAKRFYWNGRKNRWGQLYLTRNCMFEPSESPGRDVVDTTLRLIDSSFRWNKPAVISSHRVNFVGRLDVKNRDLGLKSLARLLEGIRKKWPDAEYLSGPALGELMKQTKKKAVGV
jgi:hypothetical protein